MKATAVRKRLQMLPSFLRKMKDITDGSFVAYPIPEFIAHCWRRDISSKKIAGDSSVVADKYTYKYNYCVLLLLLK